MSNEISKEQKSKSKLLALWLRHKPELICDPSEVREGGWIPWSFVVKGGIKLEMLKKVVEDDDKGRYELDEKRQWVRACQGHSFEVKMDYEVVSDIPEKLYHGTVEVVIPIVMKEGLKPMSRTHVHLSPDFDTAIKVGSRRGTPVILEIDAQEMVESGEELLVSNNGVYLCKKVDSKFITILR
jgi:putative RNA 2'-phosphotransferase